MLSPGQGDTEPCHPGGEGASPGVSPPCPPAPQARGGAWRWWMPAVTPRVGTSPSLTTVARMATRSLQRCHGDVLALTKPSKH